jgi:hypothetical protein
MPFRAYLYRWASNSKSRNLIWKKSQPSTRMTWAAMVQRMKPLTNWVRTLAAKYIKRSTLRIKTKWSTWSTKTSQSWKNFSHNQISLIVYGESIRVSSNPTMTYKCLNRWTRPLSNQEEEGLPTVDKATKMILKRLRSLKFWKLSNNPRT